ncbi:MAG: hypothetical protein JNM17_14135 [Archangium sp.]|nr:hypothetical protein [Archangium sp.]
MTRLVPLVVLLASNAFAIAKGGTLYIACKDSKLLKDAKVGAKPVSPAVLAEGSEVKWLGASEKDKSFHEVEYQGKKGFVQMSCLKPHKPLAEAAADPTFAAQAANTKCCTTGAVRYAGGSKEEQDAAAQLLKLEEFNKTVATSAAVAEKTKELHGAK